MGLSYMPSKKPRRDFKPTPEIEKQLDALPLMERSHAINEALKEYFGRPNEILAGIEEIKAMLKQILKSKK